MLLVQSFEMDEHASKILFFFKTNMLAVKAHRALSSTGSCELNIALFNDIGLIYMHVSFTLDLKLFSTSS